MRALSVFEIKNIQILTKYSVEFTLLEPTKTGLEKSIMDATGSVRLYLKSKGIHDYNLQQKGPNNKIQVNSKLVDNSSIINNTKIDSKIKVLVKLINDEKITF